MGLMDTSGFSFITRLNQTYLRLSTDTEESILKSVCKSFVMLRHHNGSFIALARPGNGQVKLLPAATSYHTVEALCTLSLLMLNVKQKSCTVEINFSPFGLTRLGYESESIVSVVTLRFFDPQTADLTMSPLYWLMLAAKL